MRRKANSRGDPHDAAATLGLELRQGLSVHKQARRGDSGGLEDLNHEVRPALGLHGVIEIARGRQVFVVLFAVKLYVALCLFLKLKYGRLMVIVESTLFHHLREERGR